MNFCYTCSLSRTFAVSGPRFGSYPPTALHLLARDIIAQLYTSENMDDFDHHAMKAFWGIGNIAPRILDLGTRCRWVVSFTPRLLYFQGKSPWYPLDMRLGGTQSRSGRGGEEKNSQALRGFEPPWKITMLRFRTWKKTLYFGLITAELFKKRDDTDRTAGIWM
jgi:hypothetical protein